MNLHTIESQIQPEMIWRPSAISQIRGFESLSALVGVRLAVLDTHRSKSIDLPVIGFEHGGRMVTVLHNFYELDLHYRGTPVVLTPEECGYSPVDAEAYRAELARAEGYTWSGWTAEELADPRITRVEVTHENGTKYWKEARPEAKDRWLARYHSAAWYSHDWSGGELLGDVAAVLDGREPRLWHARRAFINDAGRYGPNRNTFSLVFSSGSGPTHAGLIRKLLGLPVESAA